MQNPTTRRTGSIHLFHPDHPGPTLAAFRAAHSAPRPAVPVEAIDVDTLRTLGHGKLVSAAIDRDSHLLGTVAWPPELDGIAGHGQPAARCLFAGDGSLRKVVIEMRVGDGTTGGPSKGVAGMSDDQASPTPDDLATFKGGGKSGGKSGGPGKSGGSGSSGGGSLSGGHWSTIGHHHIYVVGGKVVAGGIPGKTHDARGTPKGATHSARDEGHTVASYAKKHGVGQANAYAHLDHLHRTGKVAYDHHAGSYHVPKGTAEPKAGAGHAPPNPPAKPYHKVTPGKSGMVGKPNAANQAQAQAASKSSHPAPAPAQPYQKHTPGKSTMVGKPNPANQARAEAASKAGKPEGLTEKIARKAAQAKANQAADRAAHAAKTAPAKPAPAKTPPAKPAPAKTAPAPASPARPTRTVTSSIPRDAREAKIHAYAKAKGHHAMVVTSAPKHTIKRSEGKTHHLVAGKTVASHHVENGKHVITEYHKDGTRTVAHHASAESASRHLRGIGEAAMKAGTTRHVVVGKDLGRFNHKDHGIGGKHHKVTGRILGYGSKVTFDEDGGIDMGDGFAMFKGGGAKAKAAPKSPDKSTATGKAAPKSPPSGKGSGGCGTGAGGFKAGNTCGHTQHRNATVTAAKSAHTAAHAVVREHTRAIGKLVKAGKHGTDEHKEAIGKLRGALKEAGAKHAVLREARATHKGEQREKRNAAARERRASAKVKPAEAAKPSLKDQAAAHRAGKGDREQRLDTLHQRRLTLNRKDTEAENYDRAEARSDRLSKLQKRGQPKTPSAKKARADKEVLAERDRQKLAAGQKIAERAGGTKSPHSDSGLKFRPTAATTTPTTPPHTGLTSSQARTPPTDKPSRADRAAVLAARHRALARDHRRQAGEIDAKANDQSPAHGGATGHSGHHGGGPRGRGLGGAPVAIGAGERTPTPEAAAMRMKAAIHRKKAAHHEDKALGMEIGMAKARKAAEKAGAKATEKAAATTTATPSPRTTTPDRSERAAIYRAARRVEAATPTDSGGDRLTPIHAIRDHAEKALGRPIPAGVFDRAVRDLQLRNTHEVLNLSDGRLLTGAQQARSILSHPGDVTRSQIGAYLLRNRKNNSADPVSRGMAIGRLPRGVGPAKVAVPAGVARAIEGRRAPMSRKPRASYLDQITANQKARESATAPASSHVEKAQHDAMESYKAAHEKLFTAQTDVEKAAARVHVDRAKAKLDRLHPRR